MRASLTTEARGISKQLFRQVSLAEDLIPVDAAKGSLSCGQHIVGTVIGGVGDFIDFVGKLGELTGSFAALVLQHMRRQDKIVAVSSVGINKVI